MPWAHLFRTTTRSRSGFKRRLGFRFEWNGTPTEGGGRFVNFDQSTVSLVHVSEAYNQNYNWEPRVGFIYDVRGNGQTILRAGYGLMADEPVSDVVTGLAGNPPNANPVSITGVLPVGTLYSSAALASLAPSAINPKLSNAYTESYNVNLQQQIGWGAVMQIGYIGSEGKHLRIERNFNQFIYPNGKATRPYPTLSATSPIRPGSGLGNIAYQDSDSLSDYNALWFTMRKALSHGITFNSTYAWSKSHGSEFARVAGRLYAAEQLQSEGRLRLVGFRRAQSLRLLRHVEPAVPWQFVTEQPAGRGLDAGEHHATAKRQSAECDDHVHVQRRVGHDSTDAFVKPVQYGAGRDTGQRQRVVYPRHRMHFTHDTGCNFYPQPTGFGNLHRNALTGPGFADTDLSLEKTTKITETTALVLRVDAFDLLNHVNLGNPTLSATGSATSTFGQISSTRTAVGDAGSSRQLQFAARFQF